MQMLYLIKDTLDLTKFQFNRVRIKLQSFSFSSLINDVFRIIDYQAHKKGIQFIKVIEPPLGSLMVRSDKKKLTQVLFNLMQNALKFTF